MYECHITVDKPTDPNLLTSLEDQANELGWKTSCIEGDPILGKKTYFYFTSHDKDYKFLFDRMMIMYKRLGPHVIRLKIEHIVFDTKTGITNNLYD